MKCQFIDLEFRHGLSKEGVDLHVTLDLSTVVGSHAEGGAKAGGRQTHPDSTGSGGYIGR